MRVKEETDHPIQEQEMLQTIAEHKELTVPLVVLAEGLVEIRTKAARISQIEHKAIVEQQFYPADQSIDILKDRQFQ